MAAWVAVGPLIGVIVGSAITGGFEVWERKEDSRDRDLDRLTDVVLGVQETGTDAVHQGDVQARPYPRDVLSGRHGEPGVQRA